MPDYRASWYSQLPAFGWFDREDRPGSNALGVPDWQQGIALPSRRTLGQYFNVTSPGGQTLRLRQTDVGPAPWTGRGVDVSAAAANQFGYTPKTFPTDASFTVEPAEGDSMPDMPQGRRNMPSNSLMDLLSGNTQPMDTLGQPTGWGNALASRSNSLIGLGLGLLQPYNPWAGTNPYSNALRGYMAGAQGDESAAQNAWRRQMAERQFGLEQAKFNITDAQKAMRDVLGPNPSPDDKNKFMREFYFSKLEGDWKPGTIKDPNTETEHPYSWNQRTNEYRWGPNGPPPSLQMAGGTPAQAPGADAFTRGGGGVPYTGGQRGPFGVSPEPAIPAAPTAAAPPTGAQIPPELANAPPSVRKDYQKKVAERMASGPSTHEQASIEKADDAVAANRNAISALQYAKRISPQAPSGVLAPASDYLGQAIPSLMSPETKNRLLLHNAVASNAVEQLRATFGGNPTEGERKVLIDLQGSINQPDAVRQEIFDRAIDLANKRMQLNQQRAQEIRGGTFYRPGGGEQTQGARGGGGVRRYNPQTRQIE